MDDIIVDYDKIKFGEKIGIGSSSEVFAGTYLYSPVALKKINVEGYTEKQLVTYFDLSFKSSTRSII